jgi:hypothetical protein
MMIAPMPMATRPATTSGNPSRRNHMQAPPVPAATAMPPRSGVTVGWAL